MRVKHFDDDAHAIVKASLRSLSILNPAISLDEGNKIVYSSALEKSTNVHIISGGGAGHEPSFSGFCGEGGLTASVSGNIFASPSSRQVLQAIERAKSEAGILVTVMNYTGDVLNFGVAVEKARARNPKLPVKMLVVADDCSVPKSQGGRVGNRGIAGTVLVHKITGAAAASGASLEEVFEIGKSTAKNLASIGASLDRVHVPGQSISETESLQVDQIELGMGIHNERGILRVQGDDAKSSKLVSVMLEKLLGAGASEAAVPVKHDDDIVVMVNNLGGLSVLEFGAVVAEVELQLRTRYDIHARRVYAGTYMTSLDGPGFSVSLLNATSTGDPQQILRYLDAPIDVPGWVAPRNINVWNKSSKPVNGDLSHDAGYPPRDAQIIGVVDVEPQVATIARHLQVAMSAIQAAEPDVTRYDQIVGDGDCGTTLSRGAEGVLQILSENISTTADLIERITTAIEETMDGTSGALYAIFFNALTRYVKQHTTQPESAVSTVFWADALVFAVGALRQYTPATVGDRTLMDALIPFLDTLTATKDVGAAAEAALDGAEKTKFLKASLGRAVYVGGEAEWMGKVPDPGAYGLSKLLQGLAQSIAESKKNDG